jgi:hypothetical protein
MREKRDIRPPGGRNGGKSNNPSLFQITGCPSWGWSQSVDTTQGNASDDAFPALWQGVRAVLSHLDKGPTPFEE